jgi:8-oxo-dGTP pyrophosphatase MutT (NUDIX family)
MKNPIVSGNAQDIPNFRPIMASASCYCEVEGRLLLLEEAPGRPEAGLWGVPAGKLETGETPEEGAERELWEETGIQISDRSRIRFFQTLYIRKTGLDYIYHMFQIFCDSRPEIRLSAEHTDYGWRDVRDLEKIPLRQGAQIALQYYRNREQVLPFR